MVKGVRTTIKVLALGLCVGSTAYAGDLLNSTKKRPPEKTQSAQFSRSTSVFDNWSVHCRSNDTAKSCYAETIMRTKDNPPKELLTLRVNKLEDGHGVTGIVPIGVSLDAPLLVMIAEKDNRPLQYRRCSPRACTATAKIEDGVASTLASKEAILVTFFTFARDAENGRRPNTMSVSTRGLSAALAALAE